MPRSVSSYAYHGTSAAVAAVSPNLGDAVKLSPYVRMVALPGPAGIPESQAAEFFEVQVRSAILDLNRRGIGVAALLIDSIFSSDGVWVDPPGFIAGGAAAVRDAGGLVIADEVQPGFGRTGTHMWGFERHGIVPDLVTLGKPMGNGFPIGAVVGRKVPMERFGAIARYSNTFAGNTVGIAAADAVLEILHRDKIPQHALAMSTRLSAGLEEVSRKHNGVRAVRNAGFFLRHRHRTCGDANAGQACDGSGSGQCNARRGRAHQHDGSQRRYTQGASSAYLPARRRRCLPCCSQPCSQQGWTVEPWKLREIDSG
jgi:4-aminobutyrate aminotransferase-like enzyme